MGTNAKQGKDQICVGLLAHVDAGKTTLTEALLYGAGAIRTMGRVDHGDAFLDTDRQERARGITIFSKQARLSLPDAEVTLMDTPGHVDFSTEMERVLSVLDAAILVVSASEGIQGHTRTLWNLLQHHKIPTFLFLNKMDLPHSDRERVLEALQKLDSRCVDMTQDEDSLMDALAMCDEAAMEEYLEEGSVSESTVREMVANRTLFPCYPGSALQNEGIEALLDGLNRLHPAAQAKEAFAAKVFKITRDPQGTRLTHVRLTGGNIAVKALLRGKGEDPWQEKIEQIRLYSGEKYSLAQEVSQGQVCTLVGLDHTFPGMGLGAQEDAPAPQLEPVLSYSLILPEGADPTVVLRQLRVLEEEDPMLRLSWDERYRQIRVHLMGEVQLQVLQELIAERLGLAVTFGPGTIAYRETITSPVEGMGHFEPLRHYAEVHLLLEPLPRGQGLQFGSACSEDILERNWQRLILTHLEEKTHLGVLTGSPITDMKITLVNGRAHLKHTEGGDFRQATYRAVRHGLMRTQSLLLEPMYRFTLDIPTAQLGRAISDLQRKSAELEPMQTQDDRTILSGIAPVEALQGYPVEVAAYTHGQGRLSCVPAGYAPCHNEEQVREHFAYDPTRDPENTPDSVFCSHGAGFVVPWDEAEGYMHVETLEL